MTKTIFPILVAVGTLVANPSWAVGGEVSGGVVTSTVASASGLIYGGQNVAVQSGAFGGVRSHAETSATKSTASDLSTTDETDSGLLQILSGLALVLVLVGKRLSN